ncbi:MAG: hypothetical protein GF350_00490, partial [Chitinivibrionales bacterium]|nr:hypothetical protein [Chitinivibrionales bacterium]
MRTISATLTAAGKATSRNPYPFTDIYDTIAGVKKLKPTSYYSGSEDDKFHACCMPSDGSLIRVRTDSSNNLYRSRVADPTSESTYSSWTDWSKTCYAVACAADGTNVVVVAIQTNGHLIYCQSLDSGSSWQDWLDLGDINGGSGYRIAVALEPDNRKGTIFWSDGTQVNIVPFVLDGYGCEASAYTDADSQWDNEGNASDGSEDTYASENFSLGASSTTDYAILTFDDVWGNQIKYYVDNAGSGATIEIDAYYDGGWNSIKSGAFTQGSTQTETMGAWKTISQVRIRVTIGEAGYYPRLYLCQVVGFAGGMELFNPASTTDADAAWTDDANGIDGNTNTHAESVPGAGNWPSTGLAGNFSGTYYVGGIKWYQKIGQASDV